MIFILAAGLGLRSLIDLWAHGSATLALMYGARRLRRQGVEYA